MCKWMCFAGYLHAVNHQLLHSSDIEVYSRINQNAPVLPFVPICDVFRLFLPVSLSGFRIFQRLGCDRPFAFFRFTLALHFQKGNAVISKNLRNQNCDRTNLSPILFIHPNFESWRNPFDIVAYIRQDPLLVWSNMQCRALEVVCFHPPRPLQQSSLDVIRSSKN